MKLTPPEIKGCLDSMVVVVDTREQDNFAFKRRMDAIPCPKKREKLTSGDFSVQCTLPNGQTLSLKESIAVERKMSIDELAQCFTSGRERFEREFERFKAQGGTLMLLCENASWEKIFAGCYETKMAPQALTASILAWSARYGMRTFFCDEHYSGKMIYDILYRELKERLECLMLDSSQYTEK